MYRLNRRKKYGISIPNSIKNYRKLTLTVFYFYHLLHLLSLTTAINGNYGNDRH
jgi:hypothetical protein